MNITEGTCNININNAILNVAQVHPSVHRFLHNFISVSGNAKTHCRALLILITDKIYCCCF